MRKLPQRIFSTYIAGPLAAAAEWLDDAAAACPPPFAMASAFLLVPTCALVGVALPPLAAACVVCTTLFEASSAFQFDDNMASAVEATWVLCGRSVQASPGSGSAGSSQSAAQFR